MFAFEYDTDCDYDYLWVGIPCYRDPIVNLYDRCSEFVSKLWAALSL